MRDDGPVPSRRAYRRDALSGNVRDLSPHALLWAMIALLVVFYVGGTFSPPPSSERSLAFATLGLWLFVPWGWWVDRHRVPTTRAVSQRVSPSPA